MKGAALLLLTVGVAAAEELDSRPVRLRIA
jgi:hypothetical protein